MIDIRENLSREEFFNEYFSKKKPVIIIDFAKDWSALSKWSPAYIKSVCGDHSVEIMSDRNSDPNYEINCDNHKRSIKFSDYIDFVCSYQGNDAYLVANNQFFLTESGKKLLNDITVNETYLDPSRTHGSTFFWFGPKGTFTPLHKDAIDIIFCQVVGRKKFVMISPHYENLVYNRIGVHSDVNYLNVDYDKFPLFAYTQRIEFELVPGHALFIPQGWFHCVTAIDISTSVSFTNFWK